jgi:epoxyqueuosine reductase QueG
VIENGIRELSARYPEVIFGFADISYSPFYPQYRSAIVIAVPYGKQLTTETYTEQDFEDGIYAAKVETESILHQLEILCQVHGTAYFIPPLAQSDEKELLAPFSFKYAATRAGIGWIGKNDVIITRRYGPRVRLSAMLVDAALPCGEPVTESSCPEDCTACVEACPCKALRNVKWDPSRQRGEIIDYHRCNRMRSAVIPKLGRKDACGRCFAACPVGTAGEGGEAQTV